MQAPRAIRRGLVLAAVLLLCAAAALGLSHTLGSDSATPPGAALPTNSLLPDRPLLRAGPGDVSVYPVPGSRYGLPHTQITFRGVEPSRIGPLTVTGSVTGPHRGRVAADSDRHGGSFLASTPFAPGETVTVSTQLHVLGGHDGTFSFKVEHPAQPVEAGPLQLVRSAPNGVQSFASRPDLHPPAVQIDQPPSGLAATSKDIFVAPQNEPAQNGPMILAPDGSLVWFDPIAVRTKLLATDFRVQRLRGRRVLTWWQGTTNRGSGRGVGIIADQRYRTIATVRAGNGLQVDLHEFLITPGGTAYVIAAAPVRERGLGRPLIDSVVQEIDIRTGLVLFEWHALDHVPLGDSYKYSVNQPGHVLDPYHTNSISLASDGDLIVSMRNTWATYKIDRQSGQVVWRLGGKRSSFALDSDSTTAFQHAVTAQPDGTVTVFDNGAGPPKVHSQSRGLKIALDAVHRRARVLTVDRHSPSVSSNFEGNLQALPNGEAFLGYGQRPYFTEFDADGRQDFDGRFIDSDSSYRAYRFSWTGRPLTRPAAAVRRSGAQTTIAASWNGATGVARWRVLGGRRPGALRTIAIAARTGFETEIPVRGERLFEAEAIGRRGKVLGRSRVVR